MLPETNTLEKAPEPNPSSPPPSVFSFSYLYGKYRNFQKIPPAIAGSFAARTPILIQADV